MSAEDDTTGNNNNIPARRKSKRDLQHELMAMRKDKVLELYMQGESETSISNILHCSQSTISKDLKAIKEHSKEKIQTIINSELPLAWAKARKALQYIQKEAIVIANDDKTNTPQRLAALTLFKETQESEFELITNSEILNDAFRYIEAHSKTVENIKQALEQREREQRSKIKKPENNDLSEHTTETQEAA